MEKNTIVGCSHITFLKQGDNRPFPNWINSQKWDYNSIVGNNSMPIFHHTFINICDEYSGKYKNIFLFPLRSIAFNTLWEWMKRNLDNKDFSKRMDHNLFVSAFNNEENWYVLKKYLKDPLIVDIQNEFYKMWLDWYVANIKNAKFVFWCHFGTEVTRGKFENHLCYSELQERYSNSSVNLFEFKDRYDMSKVFKDGDHHPTDYGYECIREFLEEKAN
jgi:hypothetical protein